MTDTSQSEPVPEDTGWRAVVRRNPSHEGHPANSRSAIEAVERHAAARGTYVAATEQLSNGIRVRFADETQAHVAFGFVEHSVEGIPGSEMLPIGTWNTVLPEHGDFGLKKREPEVPTVTCPELLYQRAGRGGVRTVWVER